MSLFLVESGPDDCDNSLFPLPTQRENKTGTSAEGMQQALMKILDMRKQESAELKKKLEKLENKIDSTRGRQVKALKMGPSGNQAYQLPQMFPPTCQLCGGSDHLAPTFPSFYNKGNAPQWNYNQGRSMQRSQSVQRCYTCNLVDHFR